MPNIEDVWDFSDPEGSERKFADLAVDAESPHVQAEYLTQVARAQGLQRKFDDARQTLQRAEDLIADTQSTAGVRILLESGRVLNSGGDREGSRQVFSDAFDAARSVGNDFLAVDAAHMLGIVMDGDEQLNWNIKAIEMAENSPCEKARGWLASLYNNVGWSLHGSGKYEDALDYFQRAVPLREKKGQAEPLGIAKWCVARCLRSLERVDEALEMQQSLSKSSSDGFVDEELAECLLALGRQEESRQHFAKAHQKLSQDQWLAENEPERIERLKRLSLS